MGAEARILQGGAQALLLHPSAGCLDDGAHLVGVVADAARRQPLCAVVLDQALPFAETPGLNGYARRYCAVGWALALRLRLPLYRVQHGTAAQLARSAPPELPGAPKEWFFAAFPREELRALMAAAPDRRTWRAVVVDWLDEPQRVECDTVERLCAASVLPQGEPMEYRQILPEPAACVGLPGGWQTLRPFAHTSSSHLFRCAEYPELLIKSARDYVHPEGILNERKALARGSGRVAGQRMDYRGPDYEQKLTRLLRLESVLSALDLPNVLPQYLLYQAGTLRGFVMWNDRCVYDQAGVPTEVYDLSYLAEPDAPRMFERFGLEDSAANRLYVLEQTCRCVALYHLLGVYCSDIKDDNYAILPDLRVIPIDTDGFSVNGGTAWPPRPDCRPPGLEWNGYYRHSAQTEAYALTLLLYRKLMGVNAAPDRGNAQPALALLVGEVPARTDKQLEWQVRWAALPAEIRRGFIACFRERRPPDADAWAGMLRRYRLGLPEEPCLRLNREQPGFWQRLDAALEPEIPRRDPHLYILPVRQAEKE